MRVSCGQSARTIRAEASGRIASVARVTSPEARSASESFPSTRPDGVFPAGARPDPVREGAVLGEARAAQGLADLVDAHLSRAPASREEPPGDARAPRRPRGPRRAPPRRPPARPRRPRAPDPPGRPPRRRPAPRRAVARLPSPLRKRRARARPAPRRLSLRLRRSARERRRHALGGEIDFVAGIPRGDPFAGGVQGLRRAFPRAPARARAQAAAASEARRSASSRASERARASATRPRQALLEVGEVPRRPGLLGREVAAFPLERGAARGEVQRRAAVGLEQRVVPRDRGFERRQGFPQRVAAGRGLARLEARGGQGRFGAREGGRGLGLPVPPLVAKLLGCAASASRSRSARARVSDARRSLQELGLFLVARRARRLAPQRGHVALDLGDDVGEAEEVAPRLLELAFGQPLLELVLGDAGGLLDEAAAVLRLRREHLVDAALLDDGVRAHAETRAEELVLDVPEPDLLVVEEVLALAVAVDAAAHAQLALVVAFLASLRSTPRESG